MCTLLIKLLNISKFHQDSTNGTCLTNRGHNLPPNIWVAPKGSQQVGLNLNLQVNQETYLVTNYREKRKQSLGVYIGRWHLHLIQDCLRMNLVNIERQNSHKNTINFGRSVFWYFYTLFQQQDMTTALPQKSQILSMNYNFDSCKTIQAFFNMSILT